MSDASFEDILSQPASDIKPPPVLPQGSYHTIITGLPEQGESAQKKTKFLRFIHRIVAPGADVDPDTLAELFPDGVEGTEVQNTFYLTEKSLSMLTGFLSNCGINFNGNKSLSACIDEVPNREVIVFIKHESANDGSDRIFARVGKTAPVD